MNKTKLFFMKFFGNLGCEVQDDGANLIISNIPPKFEKFSGKQGPYHLCFEAEKEGYELVTPNHYLLRAIKEFLEGRGETTLMKIDFEFDPREELPKIIPFRNSKIRSFSKTSEYSFIFKFSFSTIFQYLNKRENIITHIYVKDNQIIPFDENLKLSNGNKRDLKEVSLEKEYGLAKEKLKELAGPRTKELISMLGEMLKEETGRIKEHYENDLKEFGVQEEGILKQMATSKKESEKFKKLEKMMQNLKSEKDPKKLREEEKIFLQQEVKKHGLSIDNKLISTAIIYFPIYRMNVILDLENKTSKIIELLYNPFEKKLAPIHCQNCKEPVDEIILCSSGHVICRKCGSRCENCGEIYCPSCSTKECSHCKRKLCSRCINLCDKCRKPFCSTHINKLPGSNKKFCRDCVKRCSTCGTILDPDFAKMIDGKVFCTECSKRKVSANIMNEIFR